MTTKLSAILGAAALAALLAASPAFAAKYVRTTVDHFGNVGYYDVNPGGSDYKQINYPALGPVSSAEIGFYYKDTATADYGSLKALASVTSAPYGTAQEISGAEFADELLINSGTPGVAGFATFRLNYDGDVYAATSNSYWQYQILLKLDGSGPKALVDRSARTTAPTHIDSYVDVVIPYISGTTTNFSIKLNAIAGILGFPGAAGAAYADFSHTAMWGGLISAVTTTGVNVTSSTTVLSGTGYDYRIIPGAPAPEPAGWMLMMLGFGAAGALLRRRIALG